MVVGRSSRTKLLNVKKLLFFSEILSDNFPKKVFEKFIQIFSRPVKFYKISRGKGISTRILQEFFLKFPQKISDNSWNNLSSFSKNLEATNVSKKTNYIKMLENTYSQSLKIRQIDVFIEEIFSRKLTNLFSSDSFQSPWMSEVTLFSVLFCLNIHVLTILTHYRFWKIYLFRY